MGLGELGYDPFGSVLVGRSWSSGSEYRYGFNGYENLNELSTDNNFIDFGERIYDTRIAKFFSKDPYSAIYSYQSPYVYFSNRPISTKDIKGMGGPGIANGSENSAHKYTQNDYSNTSSNIEKVNATIKEIASTILENSQNPSEFNIASGRLTNDLTQPYGLIERGFMISQNLNSNTINISEVKEGYAEYGGSIDLPATFDSKKEKPYGTFHYDFMSSFQYQAGIDMECSGDCISDKSGLALSAADILGITPGYDYFDSNINKFTKEVRNGEFGAVCSEGKIYVLVVTDAYLYNKFRTNYSASLTATIVAIMNYSTGSLEERRENAANTMTTFNLESGLILLETDMTNINLQLVK